MKTFKPLMTLTAIAMLGAATPAFAQVPSSDTMKDAAVDKATDMAQDKAMDMAKDQMSTGAVTDMAKDHAMDTAADKVMGTSTAPSMTDMAKDHAMDKGADMAHDSMNKEHMSADTMNAPAVAVPAPQPILAPTTVPAAAPTINCPTGTTAQADGTCMVTGDYKS